MIEANIAGLALNVDPNAALGLTNQGILEATNGGILLLNGFGGSAFNNAGGVILAFDGSQVQFSNAAAITGGTLATVGSGEIHITNTATLTSLINSGTLIGNNASTTTIAGTITNTGSILINSVGSFHRSHIERRRRPERRWSSDSVQCRRASGAAAS